MDSFNFNSDSYTNNEIENLLHLTQPYNTADINTSKQRLIKQLGDRNNLGPEKQREIATFIDKIVTRIQNESEIQSLDSHRVIQQGTNFIIENPDRIVGRYAKNENGRIGLESKTIPAGYLNPINVRSVTQAISIDSRFRPNYYGTKSTNYDIVLPEIQKNVVSMRVASIELPTTYYAISLYNSNSTCVIINLANVTLGWFLTLPDGNYEQSWAHNSHAAFIETAMNSAISKAVPVNIDTRSGKITPTVNGLPVLSSTTDLTFILDRPSGKSFFTAVPGGQLATRGFIIRFNVDAQGNLNMDENIQMRLGWQLGFRAAEYVAKPQVTAAASCVSEGICLTCGPRYGFIAIDDHQKNTGPSYMVAYANSILQDNIITRINLAELQADVGVYQSASDPGLSTQLNRTREYFGPVDIQRLHISLYDEFGRIIDLNNMDWSLTLAFESLYN